MTVPPASAAIRGICPIFSTLWLPGFIREGKTDLVNNENGRINASLFTGTKWAKADSITGHNILFNHIFGGLSTKQAGLLSFRPASQGNARCLFSCSVYRTGCPEFWGFRKIFFAAGSVSCPVYRKAAPHFWGFLKKFFLLAVMQNEDYFFTLRKWEIHKVFPQFPIFRLNQKLSLSALADLIRASLIRFLSLKSNFYNFP